MMVVQNTSLVAALERTWKRKPGMMGWLSDTDHKSIALRYIVTAFIFFTFGAIEALLMRLQLARPDNHLLGPDIYNQIFTTHGSTMMFLFGVPVMLGMGLYLVPLKIGTRNVAFPRLNAYGYWAYLLGGLLLYVSFVLNIGPDAGWFAYVPLSGPQYSPGKRVDVWAQLVTFTEISALVVATNLIVTIFKQRAVGMTLNRIPIFVWSMLVTSFMVIFAMPAVMVSTLMLAMDRLVSTHFFNPAEGGDALLWQHLFWFFGHPEVYIIFIPALGFISEILVTFTRRPLFGYTAVVLSLVSTGFVAFGLWVHHMFAAGLPQLGEGFFTAASILIALPTGVQIFCWIGTLWASKPVWRTPTLYIVGFIGTFVIGGLTGVMLGAAPLDLQVHDTFFVVAHLHYVLIGGSVFPLLGAIHYWFPKMTGRMLSEKLGVIACAIVTVGFNVTFFPMHKLGLDGMPRRIYTYSADRGWAHLNLLATVGAGILGVGLLLYLFNVVWSIKRGPNAGPDPWDGATLEWATSSPPKPYNFPEIPLVESRYANWTRTSASPTVVGLSSERREVLVTTTVDAEPDHRYELPPDTAWPIPLALATGVAFIGGIFTPWAVPIAALLFTAAMIGFYWPSEPGEKF